MQEFLLHDLRNSWIDNMYMLMGKAYFSKNKLIQPILLFSISTTRFLQRKKMDMINRSEVMPTKEEMHFQFPRKKKECLQKSLHTGLPSRNESFIWQIRTYLAKDELPEAAGMIETLKARSSFSRTTEP